MNINEKVTAITVAYKTVDYAEMCIRTLREFYPEMGLILVNTSPPDDPCTSFCRNAAKTDQNMLLVDLQQNYGHGPALNMGMLKVDTEFTYIFDSDVRMDRAGMIEKMMPLVTPEAYGAGWICFTGKDGGGNKNYYHGDSRAENEVSYLHPFACLVRTSQYECFPEFALWGAPFTQPMNAIFERGLSDQLIKPFNVKEYVTHFSGGTRALYGDWPGKEPASKNYTREDMVCKR